MNLFKILFLCMPLVFSISANADVQIRDYTTAFIKGYHQQSDKSQEANKRYILRYELKKQPSACSIFFEGKPIPYDPQMNAMLDDYAKELPKTVIAYEKLIPEVKKIVAEVQSRSQKLFGMKITADVLLAPSVSPTDAVTTGNGNLIRPVVAINVHEMAQYSSDELRIVLAHELFHVLQHQLEEDHGPGVAANIYSEGWATFASSLVYPGFPDWKYISYFIRSDRQFMKFEADRKPIIRAVLRDWNSTSLSKFDKYFSADNEVSKPFEPRSGYYIGYIAAKKLAEKQSSVKVALISYKDFKKEIKSLLKELS